MRISPKWGWFAAFTAVFAVCAAYVFWGTWSTDMAPVMPDCPTSYPAHWFREWLRGWLENGKFAPSDAINWIWSPYIWTEFQYAFAAYMAALGMAYFLLGRGLSRVAAYGAGLLLAFSGYWFTLFSAGHLGWFQWMTYGVFVFGLIDRALDKGEIRHWLLLGACLAWGSMHQPDLWLLFSAFSAIYFIFRLAVCIRDIRLSMSGNRGLSPVNEGLSPANEGLKRGLSPIIWGWVKGAAAALVALFAVGGASFRNAFVSDLSGRDKQIEEGQTLGANASKNDADKRWIFATNWSMPPEATKEFFCAGIEGDTSCPMTLAIGQKRRNGIRQYTGRLGRPLGAPSGNYRQHSLYVGWVTCLLAIVGVVMAFVARRETRDAKGCRLESQVSCPKVFASRSAIVFFAVAAVVFWLFSMGRYCEPVYRIVYALPFGDYLRAPVKWHHLTEFCICVLAGYGINSIMNYELRIMNSLKTIKPSIHNSSFIIHNLTAAAIVLVGTACLVCNDRLYCAPHRADADMQFVDARMLQDPRGVAQLNQLKARVIGNYQGAALVELPRLNQEDGPVPELPSPRPITAALGILSLAGTLSVGIYGVKKSFECRRL